MMWCDDSSRDDVPNRRASIHQRPADRAKGILGDLELELFDRLADLGAGIEQCPHQHERGELAEIAGGTHRRPEARLGEGDDAVGDLPASASPASNVS